MLRKIITIRLHLESPEAQATRLSKAALSTYNTNLLKMYHLVMMLYTIA